MLGVNVEPKLLWEGGVSMVEKILDYVGKRVKRRRDEQGGEKKKKKERASRPARTLPSSYNDRALNSF